MSRTPPERGRERVRPEDNKLKHALVPFTKNKNKNKPAAFLLQQYITVFNNYLTQWYLTKTMYLSSATKPSVTSSSLFLVCNEEEALSQLWITQEIRVRV